MRKPFRIIINTNLIIISMLFTLIIHYFAPIFISYSIKSNYEAKEKEVIISNLSQYEKKENVIYFYRNAIYYKDKICAFANNSSIEYIDNEVIIYYDYDSLECVINYYNGDIIHIDLNKLEHRSPVLFHNNYIYCHENNQYYKYDIIRDEKINITKEEYYETNYSKDYKIDYNSRIIKITKDNNEVEISKKNFIALEKKLVKFELISCKEYNNNLYIYLYYNHISVIVKYDIDNDICEIYDWFKHENDVNYYRLFFAILDDSPRIIDRYFIV